MQSVKTKFIYLLLLVLVPVFTTSAFNLKSSTPQQIEIINLGTNALAIRLDMIKRATTSIDVEYFIFRADDSGNLIMQELIKKAQQGVRVRILLDHLLGIGSITPFHAFELKKLGIEVKYFNTVPLIRFSKFQYRNHRKLLIIDAKEVLTGGRNIGDEYFDLSPTYNFLDRDIVLKGSLAPEIQKTFEIYWNSKYSESISRKKRPIRDPWDFEQEYSDIELEIDQRRWDEKNELANNFIFPTLDKRAELLNLAKVVNDFFRKNQNNIFKHQQISCHNTQFISDRPGLDKISAGIVKQELFKRIKESTSDITIDTPYFIMEPSLNLEIDSALHRGVSLNILTNGLHSTDAIYTSTLLYTGIEDLMAKGTNIYIMQGQYPHDYPLATAIGEKARWGTHAKSFIFDNKDSLITTFNFDPRSSNYDLEAGIFCNNDPDTAALLHADIKYKMQHGVQLKTMQDIKEFGFKHTSFWKKFSYYLVMFPSKIFQYLL